MRAIWICLLCRSESAVPPRNAIDFSAPPAFETEGLRVAAFIERYCRHSKAEWAGQRLVLEPWQRWALNEIFRVDPKTGYRFWRQVLWMLPRKNAKSTTLAAAGHYLLGFDGEGGPEGYSGAWGTEQASITLDAAKAMRDMSPTLRRRTIKYAKQIACRENGGVWKVVSRVADMQQGTNPHFALIDEYHVHQRSDLYDAFKRGTQARRQPLILLITTEGDTSDGPLGNMQEGFAKTEGGVEQITPYLSVARDERSRSLMLRWGLSPDSAADIENPDVVRGCNPAGWLDPERIIAEYLHQPGSRERDFRRYHLNQLVADAEVGVSAAEWDACRDDDLELQPGQEVCIGVDVGVRDDWSAVVVAGMVGERMVVRSWLWEPPGKGFDLDIRATVENKVRELMELYRVSRIGVDKFLAGVMLQDWHHLGWPAEDFPMHDSSMCPASVDLYEAIQRGRVAHDGDTQLRTHVLNAIQRDTSRSRWRFDKPKDSRKKIDGLIGLVIASRLCLSSEPNLLEQHGLFI